MRYLNAGDVGANAWLPRPQSAPGSPGTLTVVGGHSRGVGKTATIEALMRREPCRHWAAVKVSAHRHCADDALPALVERTLEASSATQTGRYLLAGATEAFLCRTPAARLGETAAFIQQLQADGFDVIVESNRIVEFVRPDLVLFVISPHTRDWKPSSRTVLAQTDVFVINEPDESLAREALRAVTANGCAGVTLASGDAEGTQHDDLLQ